MILAKPRLELGGMTLCNFHSLAGREAAMVLRWRNSAGVRRWMYSDAKITPAEHAAFRRRLKEDASNGYWLVKGPGRRWAGVVYLNRIDQAAGRAWLGIYTNPESDAPGKGPALMEALERLAFRKLGLKRLRLEVFATNLRAVSFYRSRGFRAVRLVRGRVNRRGEPVDVREMQLRPSLQGK